MTIEIASAVVAASKETAKEIGKELGIETAKKTVDVCKRIDEVKSPNNIPSGGIDITKRIPRDVIIENSQKDLAKLTKEYIDDMKAKSICPDTIRAESLEVSRFELKSPEEITKLRDEFVEKKQSLRREWEVKNNQDWPKYTNDVVYNGTTIRKAGDYFDAHHPHPLQLGGKNEVDNITPMDVRNHVEIHRKTESCSKLVEAVKEAGRI